jgi:hypothetical protein
MCAPRTKPGAFSKAVSQAGPQPQCAVFRASSISFFGPIPMHCTSPHLVYAGASASASEREARTSYAAAFRHNCAWSCVGTQLLFHALHDFGDYRGISGGQAKRTNVALAMVVNPRVLFLDEPTSGLDSYTSNETMTVVKSLVKEGVTICATIHSPSPYTFALFDRLLVLVRGECVYHGPNGPAMVCLFDSHANSGQCLAMPCCAVC